MERQGALLDQQERHQLRQNQNAPLLKEFNAWLLSQRQQLMNADVTAKAMDYTLKRWAAVLMTLIESAKLNGLDAWVYLKDVLTKLPTWPNGRLQELLPHRWVPPETASTTTPALVNT